jgi:prepilin-type N-terminal cleavage/methylation domain-containing protein
MTLIELMVVLAILTIALSMFSRTLVSSARLDPLNRETVIAGEGARSQLEAMRNNMFREIFALYNDDPGDDPDGAGTAPGSRFAVDGLEPLAGRDYVGTVSFPVIDGALREDLEDDPLGMPRDLNADGEIDSGAHTDDYALIPVRIRIEWQGRGGERQLDMYTMFVDL